MIVVPPHRRDPSAEERQLADTLVQAVRDHRDESPGLTYEGVLRAFQHAQQQLAAELGGYNPRKIVVVALAVLTVVLAAVAVLTGSDSFSLAPEMLHPLIMVAVAGLLVLFAAFVAAVKSRARGGDSRAVVAVLVGLLLLLAFFGLLFFLRQAPPQLPLS